MRKKRPYDFVTIGAILLSIAVIFLVFASVNQHLYEEARIQELVSEKEKEIVGSASYLQSTLSLVREIGLDVAYDWNVISYCGSGAESSEARNAAIAKLRTSANSYAYIQSMALICEQRQEVLTSHEGWFSMENFYDQEILDDALLEKYSESGGIIGTRSFVTRNAEEVSVVTIVSPLFNMGESSGNYVVCNVRTSRLLEGMDIENWEHGTDLMICDLEGNVIMDNSEGRVAKLLENQPLQSLQPDGQQVLDISVDGNNAMLVRWMDESDGLIFTSICPVEDGFKPLIYLRNLSILLMAGALVSMVALGFLLIYKVYRPYHSIVNKIQRASTVITQDENLDFRFIERTLDSILSANSTMQDAYLESMLIGGSQRGPQLELHSWQPGSYRALLFSPSYGEDVDNFTINLEIRKLQEVLSNGKFTGGAPLRDDQYRFVPLKDSNFVMLLTMDGDMQNLAIKDSLAEVLRRFNLQSECRWSVGVSCLHEDGDLLNLAYEECSRAIEFRYFRADRDVFMYEELKDVPHYSYFPDDIKMSMFSNNLLSMNYAGAQSILHEIADDILEKSEKTFFYNVPNILVQFRDLIIKSTHTNGIREEAVLMGGEYHIGMGNHTYQTMEAELDALDRLFEQLRPYAEERDGSGTKTLGNKMQEYVCNNYHQDISLTSMALNFGMTESYLSSRFKEVMGVSFIKYVTKLRIDEVKKLLLEEPKMRIADIAEQVGMGNAQNLIRVFKKYEGITPGQYRDRNVQ